MFVESAFQFNFLPSKSCFSLETIFEFIFPGTAQLDHGLCRFHIGKWVRVGAEEPISVNAKRASDTFAYRNPLDTRRISTSWKPNFARVYASYVWAAILLIFWLIACCHILFSFLSFLLASRWSNATWPPGSAAPSAKPAKPSPASANGLCPSHASQPGKPGRTNFLQTEIDERYCFFAQCLSCFLLDRTLPSLCPRVRWLKVACPWASPWPHSPCPSRTCLKTVT